MSDEQDAQRRTGVIGKGMTSVGVIMLAASFILGFASVGGAGLHNFLQFGGIVLLLLGYVVWKVLKL